MTSGHGTCFYCLHHEPIVIPNPHPSLEGRSVRLRSICLLFQVSPALAGSQAPYVKTTYGVSPAKMTLWATMHEPLSDEDTAKVNLKLFAEGNKDAAWELGLAYMQGLGVSQDFAKAERMFQIGAVDEDKKAMVGMFYAHGYFPEDLDAVDRWYTAAGTPSSFFELAETYKAAAQKRTAPLQVLPQGYSDLP